MPTVDELNEQLRTHAAAAKAILGKAQTEGRDVTPDEERQATAHIDLATHAKARRDQARSNAAVRKAIEDIGNGISGGAQAAAPVHPRIKAAGGTGQWATKVMDSSSDRSGGYKALLPSGAVPVTVPLNPEPVRADEPVLALRQLIPSRADTAGRWSYMKQSVRTSNAAVVAPGARKPTSVFSLVRVEERTHTLAHLSEPVARQDLDDAPMLQRFLDVEMRLGLEVALEDEILNGDGTGEHFTGLANTSGSQAQAYDTNLLTTTRKAITKLETLSLAPSGWVFSPLDWERLELLTDNEASYMLSSPGASLPVDRAARRLWGIPVVVTTSLAAGTGYLVDFTGSTELRIREDARMDWSENIYRPDQFGEGIGGNDFEANQITFRCEMRAGFAVTRPSGVVELDLTAE